MNQFAKPGDFCPNEACPDYGKLQDGQTRRNIIKSGRTQKGVQHCQCKTCRATFTATADTIFYRKRTPDHQILETLALLAEGSRISSLSRAKGFKEDTTLAWLREAAQHAGQVEEVLMVDFRVKRGRLDAPWSYVRNKGGKRLCRDQRKWPILAFTHARRGEPHESGTGHCQK